MRCPKEGVAIKPIVLKAGTILSCVSDSENPKRARHSVLSRQRTGRIANGTLVGLLKTFMQMYNQTTEI